MDGTSFTMTFFGEGYSEGQDPQNGKPNVKICTEVKGPGVYVSSSSLLLPHIPDSKRGLRFHCYSFDPRGALATWAKSTAFTEYYLRS